ncbi:MAG: hypothetical protein OEZ54_11185, partial [Gemmatimonadota bacterium]|nr:hypothetical protein [Gemmatimonadota bacterium]
MTEDGFEDFMKDAAKGYRKPPSVPREAMWQRIQEVRLARRARFRTVAWGAGMAAALVIGVAIGRYAYSNVEMGQPIASGVEEEGAHGAYRYAAADHFERADAFLAMFAAEAEAGTADEEIKEWALNLMVTTQLMLQSPAAEDPAFRELLEDLEAILVQIAGYEPEWGEMELELIEDGIQERNVVLRLQT